MATSQGSPPLSSLHLFKRRLALRPSPIHRVCTSMLALRAHGCGPRFESFSPALALARGSPRGDAGHEAAPR